MIDIFFSYSSKDRGRVRLVRDALTDHGFEVFWDQSVPANSDWDTWIRQHLRDARCAIVFWSQHSIISDNVRHEATVAKLHGKLVPVLLDALTPDEFPMGFYAQQGANLTAWSGDLEDTEWEKLRTQVESKLTPAWMLQRVHALEAELLASNLRLSAADVRDRTLRAQLAKDATAQVELKRERDVALDEVAFLRSRLEEAIRARVELESSVGNPSRQATRVAREHGHPQAMMNPVIAASHSEGASATSPPSEDEDPRSADDERCATLEDGVERNGPATSHKLDAAAEAAPITVVYATTGMRMGRITESQYLFMTNHLNSTQPNSGRYYLTPASIKLLQDKGGRADLIVALRRILGGKKGVEIRCVRQ